MQVMPADFEDQQIAESGQKRLTMQLQMYDMGVDLMKFECIELDFADIAADAACHHANRENREMAKIAKS